MTIADYNSAAEKLKAFVRDSRKERRRRNPKKYGRIYSAFANAAAAMQEFAKAVNALNKQSPPFPVGGITHQGEELIIDKKGNIIK